MGLREHKCQICGETRYVFEGEEKRKLEPEACVSFPYDHDWKVLPPQLIVIHTTDTWMSEPQLDSFQTTYELDRQLNIEAQIERETKLLNEARKNL